MGLYIDLTLFKDYDHDYDQHFDTSIRKRTHRGPSHICIHRHINRVGLDYFLSGMATNNVLSL